MLRRTRIFVVIFFIFSVTVWGVYQTYTRMHTDKTSPVITMDEDAITVSVEEGDAAILKGVTAKDEKDGDLTDRIFIESRSKFVDKGLFTVTYAVADSDNHVTKASRQVTYSDYHSPRFELSAPLKYQTSRETQDDLNIAANLSVHDSLDGNISNKIRISGDYTLSSYSPGDYPMEFIVTNSMGDTSRLPVTVTIYSGSDEKYLPKITLSHYLVNTPVGNALDPFALISEVSYAGYTYHRAEDGNFYSGEYDKNGQPVMFTPDNLTIESNVDYNVPGTYEAKISYTDAREGVSNYAYMYIVVND